MVARFEIGSNLPTFLIREPDSGQLNLEIIDFSQDDIYIPELDLQLKRVKHVEDPKEAFKDSEVAEARQRSYGVYGDVPVIDSYDGNAAIYKARMGNTNVTLRFIWGRDGLEDIEHNCLVLDGQQSPIPLGNVVGNFQYTQQEIGAISRLAKTGIGGEAGANEVAVAYAAFQFMVAADAKRLGVKAITCQGQPALVNKITALGDVKLGYVPAVKTFGLDDIGVIKLNRDNEAWRYLVSFPGYFLRVQGDQTKGEIGIREILTRFLGKGYSVDGVNVVDLTWKNVKAFVPLILGSNDIMQAVRQEVPDAVDLYMMEIDPWVESAGKLLESYYQDQLHFMSASGNNGNGKHS